MHVYAMLIMSSKSACISAGFATQRADEPILFSRMRHSAQEASVAVETCRLSIEDANNKQTIVTRAKFAPKVKLVVN